MEITLDIRREFELLHHWLMTKHASTPKLAPCNIANPIKNLYTMFCKFLEKELGLMPPKNLARFRSLLKQLNYRTGTTFINNESVHVVYLNAYVVPFVVKHKLNRKSPGRPRRCLMKQKNPPCLILSGIEKMNQNQSTKPTDSSE